jgi:hypothetical protein
MRSLLVVAVVCALPGMVWAQGDPAPTPPAEPGPTPKAEPGSAPAPSEPPPEVKPAPAQQVEVEPVKAASEPAAKAKPIVDFFPLSGGRASFPLVDSLDPLVIEAHLSVYGQYVLSVRDDNGETDWFHEFELPRAHARIDAAFEGARARVMVEGVRSASEGSLLGVAGDSFVLRLREAWLAYTAWGVIETRVGLVPTMTIGPVESLWGMRMVAPTAIERAGLLSPADLGGTVRGFFPKGFGWVGAGAYNGEGYTQRELNRGKNIEVATEVHPFAFSETAAPFTVLASYSSGSSGTALARSNRVSTSLGWQGDVVRGGASFTYAWGIADQGDTLSALAEGFIRVRPIERLSLGANGMFWSRDLAADSDWTVTITGSVGYFIVDPLGVFLAVDGFLLGGQAEEALPPKDDVRFRVIGAVDF